MKKVFCIPYAGGNASVFKKVRIELEKEGDIQVYCYEYAGHGRRFKEGFNKTMSEVVCDCKKYIYENTNSLDEIILFGYSMGSLVAFEVARVLEAEKCNLKLLIAAANQAPSVHVNEMYTNDLEIIDAVVKMGGFDQRLLSNKRYMNMILPVIVNDFKLLAGYREAVCTDMIKSDIIVMKGKKDYKHGELYEWRNHTEGTCEIIEFDSGHFFILEKTMDVIDILKCIV